jgi:ABC-type bacteriocin/lantibiotic exporter with double-glycine peptidase domain
MSNRTKTRRRWFGVFCIVAAIVMLIAGETVLKAKLAGVGLLCYWMACLILTALAALAAIVDAARVSQEHKAEQRLLLEETLQKIEREKKSSDEQKRR